MKGSVVCGCLVLLVVADYYGIVRAAPAKEASYSKPDESQPNIPVEESWGGNTGLTPSLSKPKSGSVKGPNPGSDEPELKNPHNSSPQEFEKKYPEELGNKHTSDKVKGPNPGGEELEVYNLNQRKEEPKKNPVTTKTNNAVYEGPKTNHPTNSFKGPNPGPDQAELVSPLGTVLNQGNRELPKTPEHNSVPLEPKGTNHATDLVKGPNPGPDQAELVSPLGTVLNQGNGELPKIPEHNSEPIESQGSNHAIDLVKGPNPGPDEPKTTKEKRTKPGTEKKTL